MSENTAPWEYGQALTAAIKRSGMSKHEIGRLISFSSTRIKHLEDGFAPGSSVPARPRTKTVVRLASVLNMDLRRALELSGKADEIPDGMSDSELWVHFQHLVANPLTTVSDEDLLDEVARRFERKNGDDS